MIGLKSYSVSSDYPTDWDRRRKDVFKRDGFRCQNCGASGGPNGSSELHAHHIVPKSKGGKHKRSNLSTLCEDCHMAIHSSNKSARKSPNEKKYYKKTIDKEHKLRIKTRRESKWYGTIFGILVGFSLYISLNLSFIQYLIFSIVLTILSVYLLYRLLQFQREIEVEFKKVFTRS
jgi:hypothetical protein